MNILTDMTILFKAGFSTKHYYKAFNRVYKQFFGEYYMLHYPLYKNDQDNLLQCQKNLIDYCLGKLPSLIGENVLEIGCGNGIQALYLYKKYTPAQIVGIDLNEENIKIANLEKERQNIQNIDFFVSDAQDVKQIDDNSIDIVINIESAFHYPDKEKFLSEVHRVLKPGGRFVIADILTRKKKSNSKSWWGKKMNFYHWPLDRYRDILSKSDLAVDTWEDITPLIIKGYNVCRKWVNEYEDISGKPLIRIWGNTMMALNSYLLKRIRSYYVFAGAKPTETTS